MIQSDGRIAVRVRRALICGMGELRICGVISMPLVVARRSVRMRLPPSPVRPLLTKMLKAALASAHAGDALRRKVAPQIDELEVLRTGVAREGANELVVAEPRVVRDRRRFGADDPVGL